MQRSLEKLNLIPGERDFVFVHLHHAIRIALAQQPQRQLEPKFIEHNREPLSEESSSTLCCRLLIFGQGSRPSQNELSSSRIKRCAPA